MKRYISEDEFCARLSAITRGQNPDNPDNIIKYWQPDKPTAVTRVGKSYPPRYGQQIKKGKKQNE